MPVRTRHLIIIIAGLILASSSAYAQNYIQPYALDLWSGQAQLSNPAVISFQRSMLQLGMRFFQLGFADDASFRLNYASLVLPHWLPEEIAFAAHVNSISIPIYRQSYFSASLSRRMSSRLSIGLKGALLSRYYDAGDFNLIDEDDPVFAGGRGKSAFDLGAGITYWPLPFLNLALSRDHLNTPNIALGDPPIRLAPENHLAVGFVFGNLQTSVVAIRDRGEFTPGGYAELSRPDLGFVRLSMNRRAVEFQGRAKLYGPVSLNYSLDYPTNELQGATSGSHEFALVFEFDRIERLPKIEEPPSFTYPFDIPPSYFVPKPAAYAQLQVEELSIVAQQLVRIIERDVSAQALAALSPQDLGMLDTTLARPLPPFNIAPILFADTTARLSGSYSTSYRQSLRQLEKAIAEESTARTTIVATPHALRRAQALRNYLAEPEDGSQLEIGVPSFVSRTDSVRFYRRIGPSAIVPKEERIELSPPDAIFAITAANFDGKAFAWQLRVENEAGTEIWQQEGTGRLPDQIVWNWKNRNGKTIAPGVYHYYITWRTSDGQVSQTPTRTFHAKKLQRTVRIHVKRRLDDWEGEAEEVRMILKK